MRNPFVRASMVLIVVMLLWGNRISAASGTGAFLGRNIERLIGAYRIPPGLAASTNISAKVAYLFRGERRRYLLTEEESVVYGRVVGKVIQQVRARLTERGIFPQRKLRVNISRSPHLVSPRAFIAAHLWISANSIEVDLSELFAARLRLFSDGASPVVDQIIDSLATHLVTQLVYSSNYSGAGKSYAHFLTTLEEREDYYDLLRFATAAMYYRDRRIPFLFVKADSWEPRVNITSAESRFFR